jgi:NAD(P)-dependent dehydrogenase (short-subunit alcohol dehydrogenase family)
MFNMAVRARTLIGSLYRAHHSRLATERLQSVRRSIAAGNALKDKVAIVTGASSGIGLAITSAFARAGAHCVLVAIDSVRGDAALNDLAAKGLRAELQVADVSDPAQVQTIAAEIAQRYPVVDILVNNAGVFLDEDREMHASAVRDEIVARTLAVNLYGAIHACTAFDPLLQRGSRVINISSVMGLLSRRSDGYAPAYRLSKAAFNSYAQSLAADLKTRGVMVDCVHPGWVKTSIGGPNAEIDPADSTDTVFYLATREQTDETGLFWWDCRVIPW